MFPAGTVFLWKNFPATRDPSATLKDRWFICLGRSEPSLVPLFIYLCTTTSKVAEYAAGSLRHGHEYFVIRRGESCLPQDSVVDLTTNFYAQITRDQMVTSSAQIEQKGSLSENLMRRLYKFVASSVSIPPKIKRDIHESFNLVGITGLKRP